MKISQMIIDLALDFIELGSTLEEKQNYLNAASIAWNISILPASVRKKALIEFLATYKQNNPKDDEDNIRNIERDMELLIKKKIRTFPNVFTPIEHAKITENDGEYKIVVASSANKKQSLAPGNPAISTIIKH
jgi:hypothetical protein